VGCLYHHQHRLPDQITAAELVIDLRSSFAGVVIDTAYGGAGSQAPLPAELAAGKAILSPVSDGDQQLIVAIGRLDVDTPIRLQMDVDDTAAFSQNSRIAVASGELAGATVTLRHDGAETHGTFDRNGFAFLPAPETLPDCNLIG